MRLGARLACLFVLVAGGFACGPSFQVVYEGDSRFEHCYALDENPNVLMQQKSECWSDWIKHYTYGQTRDRVEFAAVRYRAILRAGSLPTDEAIMGAAPGEGSGLTIGAPAPTNAFASPPKTMDEDAGSSKAPAPMANPPSPNASSPSSPPVEAAPALQPPGGACLDDCTEKWHGCWTKCGSKACTACDKSYRQCGRACLAGAPPR
jgi:hypothetical protein